MVKRALIFSLVFIFVLFFSIFSIFNSLALRDFAKRLLITQSYNQFGIKLDVNDVRISYFRPSLRISGINVIKAGDKDSIILSSEEAYVYFNVLKLVRGKLGISGFKFHKPVAQIETAVKEDIKSETSDVAIMWNKLLELDIKRFEVNDGQFKIRIKGPHDQRSFEFSDLDVKIKRGILSNYLVDLSSKKVATPFEQLKDLDIKLDVGVSDLRIIRADLGITGGRIYAGGVISNYAQRSY